MNGIAINPRPLMTRYLVQELRTFADDPVVIFDVGARGGINQEWSVFGNQLQVICFEPDEEECMRLDAEDHASPEIRYIPCALGRTSGMATLYEASQPASSGLYKTKMDYFGRFLNRDNGVTVSERQIVVRSLDDVVKAYDIASVDFVKLDVEGAELDVLEGGEALLRGGGLLGILSEIRFHREINGSAPFASLDAFLQNQGFRLFNLQANQHSRIALPYPQLGDYRLPSGARFFAYTTHGQVQDGDALYFRDLLIPGEVLPRVAAMTTVLKLCSLMEIYSLNDCAAELIIANRKELQKIVEPDKLLDLLSAGIAGGSIGYEPYVKAYFNGEGQSKVEASGVDAPVGQQAGKQASKTREVWARLVHLFMRH